VRELTSHKVNGVNDGLQIVVLDEPGPGGAHHKYGINLLTNQGCSGPIISFQNGPIKEAGVNGVTNESLLAILIDRLECFQSGPFACEENAEALDDLRHALRRLRFRTKTRLARGV